MIMRSPFFNILGNFDHDAMFLAYRPSFSASIGYDELWYSCSLNEH